MIRVGIIGARVVSAWRVGRGLLRQLVGHPDYAVQIVKSIAAVDLGVKSAKTALRNLKSVEKSSKMTDW
jgi:isoprenylcysteine carboxyl methyltransferase (ICMT) family protein YpbQ